MRILSQRRKDARLIVVGEGEMGLFLRTQAKLLDIEDKVRFTGYVPDEELPKFFGLADVFVLPSITAEAFGIVLLEAMASGRPVVTTRVGGIPEVVEGSGCGILVDPGDEQMLADAILLLLEDKGLREELGRRGREVAEDTYSWDVITERIEGVYREVI